MNEPLNATNATILTDCPWCAEPIRASAADLYDGLACPTCRVEIRLSDAPSPVDLVVARAIAA